MNRKPPVPHSRIPWPLFFAIPLGLAAAPIASLIAECAELVAYWRAGNT